MSRRCIGSTLGLLAILAPCSCERWRQDPSPRIPEAPPVRSLCPEGPPRGEPGQRVLALVVGVSDYASAEIPDLKGAAGDAAAIYGLLTGEGGFHLPPENVCLLADGDATLDAVRRAFQDRLVARAEPGDEAIFYFAGHGSSTYDLDGDETDGWDGTLVLADATSASATQLVDDELARWIAALQAKTSKVTLLLDACSSGTSARGGTRSRTLPPAREAASTAAQQTPLGANGVRLDVRPDVGLRPGLLSLAAARDGTNALEPAEGGRGYFTAALLEALRRASQAPATWTTVFRETEEAVSRRSFQEQIPVLQGDDRRVALRPEQGARAALSEVREQDAMSWEQVSHGPQGDGLGLKLVDADTGAVLRPCTDDLTVVRPGQRWTVQVENRRAGAVFLRGGVLLHDAKVADVALPLSDLSPELPGHATALLDRDAAFVAGPVGGPDLTLVVAGRVGEPLPRRFGEGDITADLVRSMSLRVAEEPALSRCDQPPPPLLTYDLAPQIQAAASNPPLTRLLQAVATTSLGAEDPVGSAFVRACLPLPTPDSRGSRGRPCAAGQVGDVLVRPSGERALLIDPANAVVWTKTSLGARYLRLPEGEDPSTLACTRALALAGGPDLEASACAR